MDKKFHMNDDVMMTRTNHKLIQMQYCHRTEVMDVVQLDMKH
jgi:hypothetical protein